MRNVNPCLSLSSGLASPLVRSLCAQLLLQTLLSGFEQAERLKALSFLKIVQLKQQIDWILKELEKMYLSSVNAPLSEQWGVLDLLQFYSELLIKHSNYSGEQIFPLLERSKLSFLRIRSEMIVWKKVMSRYSLEDMQETLVQFCHDLLGDLRRFFSALVPFLQEMRSDENVLTYLLEHREEFNRSLGDRSIELLLQSFFPAGHDQLRAVIYEGYTKRGFSSFFSQVEPLIENVRWEEPCPFQQNT